MRVSQDRYRSELRQHDLAVRMIRHEARTHTVRIWTGLCDDRVRRLCRTYDSAAAGDLRYRHRGPAPQNLSNLLYPPAARAEASAMAGICRRAGVLARSKVPEAAKHLPSVRYGEELCAAFELYRQIIPGACFSLEQLMCLVLALCQAEEVALGGCARCGALILIDRLGLPELRCLKCQSETISGAQRRTGGRGMEGVNTTLVPWAESGNATFSGFQHPLF